ncbi:DNA cytosine methyltransferase [Leucobacter chromiireducens subsp. solipictus]|uniref:DNA (cytosine-5-)-methyltransferase n=1 Tax=Leucobacter chromiireducens subsp. solipictus TaxID=398235 RepID=A0ABS1SEC0_9MICO|nr:DNA cytosine methyltransferase [Leucobacter chromiireducens subsp. solipictus]
MREAQVLPSDPAPPRVGSLFSGYGGLDLAVEHVFHAQTIWFSEISPVQHVFAHHWPDAPNLGDITSVNWAGVEPVDILCGGFPCQDVSTVGKMAGLAPGTRSGLWSYMAEAIDQLRPEFVVIENVRGLLSASAIRATPEGGNNATPHPATLRDLEPGYWGLGDDATRPLRAAGAVLGDLADIGYDAQWIGLPASTVGAPHPRFRVFILAHDPVPHPARLRRGAGRGEPGSGESTSRHDRALASDHRHRIERAGWLGGMEARTRDVVVADRRHTRRWGRYADAIARWEHITGRQAPAPTILNDTPRPRPAPEFVEWLMGLPSGWVTDPTDLLTANQQLAALGNGVLPLQARAALQHLKG